MNCELCLIQCNSCSHVSKILRLRYSCGTVLGDSFFFTATSVSCGMCRIFSVQTLRAVSFPHTHNKIMFYGIYFILNFPKPLNGTLDSLNKNFALLPTSLLFPNCSPGECRPTSSRTSTSCVDRLNTHSFSSNRVWQF